MDGLVSGLSPWKKYHDYKNEKTVTLGVGL